MPKPKQEKNDTLGGTSLPNAAEVAEAGTPADKKRISQADIPAYSLEQALKVPRAFSVALIQDHSICLQFSLPNSEGHLFLVNRQNLHDFPYLSANKGKIILANMSQSPFAN